MYERALELQPDYENALLGLGTILAQVQRWHRATRQRVVNAIPLWSEQRQRVVWQLTAGMPAGADVAA